MDEQPMTATQAKYLKTLCAEAGEPFHANLSEAEASKLIQELQEKGVRGTPKLILENKQSDG